MKKYAQVKFNHVNNFWSKKHIVETPTLKCVCICLSWKSFRPREKTSPGIVDYKPLTKTLVFTEKNGHESVDKRTLRETLLNWITLEGLLEPTFNVKYIGVFGLARWQDSFSTTQTYPKHSGESCEGFWILGHVQTNTMNMPVWKRQLLCCFGVSILQSFRGVQHNLPASKTFNAGTGLVAFKTNLVGSWREQSILQSLGNYSTVQYNIDKHVAAILLVLRSLLFYTL